MSVRSFNLVSTNQQVQWHHELRWLFMGKTHFYLEKIVFLLDSTYHSFYFYLKAAE